MVSRILRTAAQAVHAVLAVVGVVGTVVTIVKFIEFVKTLPIPGHLPGGSGQGNFFAVTGGMTIALFATIAFITVARGGRWAYWLSVPIWTVVYMLFDYLPFFFTRLIRRFFGLPISEWPDTGIVGAVCTAGIVLAFAAYAATQRSVSVPDKAEPGLGTHGG
ncbi:hypothetical protein D6T65_15570 [Arthrobacter frigidicola]|nr:hypothetical protein D6T65_15570 [Arthrobacter frigidicola]